MRQELKGIVKKLIEVRRKVQGYLNNAEKEVHPNQDRIDSLQSELDCLDAAMEVLQEID